MGSSALIQSGEKQTSYTKTLEILIREFGRLSKQKLVKRTQGVWMCLIVSNGLQDVNPTHVEK